MARLLRKLFGCFVDFFHVLPYLSAVNISEKQQELVEELELFQDWTERYEYVISLGKRLPAMDGDLQTADRLIRGCQSQVWLEADCLDGKMSYLADSDSVITKGMIALFVRVIYRQNRPQRAPRSHSRKCSDSHGGRDEETSHQRPLLADSLRNQKVEGHHFD